MEHKTKQFFKSIGAELIPTQNGKPALYGMLERFERSYLERVLDAII